MYTTTNVTSDEWIEMEQIGRFYTPTWRERLKGSLPLAVPLADILSMERYPAKKRYPTKNLSGKTAS